MNDELAFENDIKTLLKLPTIQDLCVELNSAVADFRKAVQLIADKHGVHLEVNPIFKTNSPTKEREHGSHKQKVSGPRKRSAKGQGVAKR